MRFECYRNKVIAIEAPMVRNISYSVGWLDSSMGILLMVEGVASSFTIHRMIYICTQTINIYHYGAEKDRTYNFESDCFRDNRHHWCFSVFNIAFIRELIAPTVV